jgi:DNA polymerase-3 subunit gamma/tau
VAVVEKEGSNEPAARTLSSKEQYLKIIEEYPLVKELKDRLRLELDY